MSITGRGDKILFKFQLIGDQQVGKTSIMYQLCGQPQPRDIFDKLIRPMMDYVLQYRFGIQAHIYREDRGIQIYLEGKTLYFQQLIQQVLIFYFHQKYHKDRYSIEQIYDLYKEFRLDRFNSQQGPVVIVANKCDLEEQRQNLIIFFKVITPFQLREVSNQLGIDYFEVSAKDYRSLDQMIEIMLQQCVQKYLKDKNINEPTLSQYYIKQNNQLKKKITEYQFKFKIFMLLNICIFLTFIPLIYVILEIIRSKYKIKMKFLLQLLIISQIRLQVKQYLEWFYY